MMTRRLPLVVVALLPALLFPACRHARVTTAPNTSAPANAAPGDTSIYSAATLPAPGLGYNAREGRAVYRHYCLNCHGDQGKGDGFNAYNLDPKPASLADSTFQVKHTDADLLTAIKLGGGAVGLSTGMPPWGRTLSERQMSNIVDYLRTLDEAKHR